MGKTNKGRRLKPRIYLNLLNEVYGYCIEMLFVGPLPTYNAGTASTEKASLCSPKPTCSEAGLHNAVGTIVLCPRRLGPQCSSLPKQVVSQPLPPADRQAATATADA
jgi:hypothetical protein